MNFRMNFRQLTSGLLYIFIAMGFLFPNQVLKAQEMFFHLLGMGPRFSITGITSNNTTDATLDANLNYDTFPVVNWQAVAGADSYDVTIYRDDRTTVQCAQQNSVATSFAFPGCALTIATYYRVHLQARRGSDLFLPENLWYRFYVNRAPTITSTGPWYMMVGSGNCFDISALYSAPPGVGIAADADGHTLSFQSVGPSVIGNTIANNSTYIRYTNTLKRGVDTFNFTIRDTAGGSVGGTLNIYSMDAFSWTGGAGSNTYETAGNWCSSINANKTGCVGSATAPINTSSIYIDNRCTSAFCDPTTTDTNSAANIVMLSQNSLTIGPGLNFMFQYMRLSGGIFNGGTGTLSVNNALGNRDPLVLSGSGVFNSTTGTMNISLGEFNKTLAMQTLGGGIFNHNNGLVRINANAVPQAGADACDLSSGTNYCKSTVSVASTGTTTFYNLDFLQSEDGIVNSISYLKPGLSVSDGVYNDGGKIVVTNTMNVGNGAGFVTNPILNLEGNFELAGDLNLNSETTNLTFAVNLNAANITFNGAGNQNLAVNGTGQVPGGNIIVDKAAGNLILGTNFSLPRVHTFSLGNAAGDITVTNGLLDMNGFNLTVENDISNSGTIKQGNNPLCGVLTSSNLTGNAPICP